MAVAVATARNNISQLILSSTSIALSFLKILRNLALLNNSISSALLAKRHHRFANGPGRIEQMLTSRDGMRESNGSRENPSITRASGLRCL